MDDMIVDCRDKETYFLKIHPGLHTGRMEINIEGCLIKDVKRDKHGDLIVTLEVDLVEDINICVEKKSKGLVKVVARALYFGN